MKAESSHLPKAENAGSKWKSDILASLVVFMDALPLCIAIARASGLPAEAGLLAGIIGGLIVGPLAGSPLQVSGPAAGLIVLVLEFVNAQTKAFESGASPYAPIVAFGVVVFLAGLLQLLMALLRLGQWFRAVSPAVVLGMLAGIGVVIFAKQIHGMIDDVPDSSVAHNLLSVPSAVKKALSDPEHRPAAVVGIMTLLILLSWKAITPKRIQLIPPALVAVIVGTLVAEGVGLSAQRIQIESNLLNGMTWLTPGTLFGLAIDPAVIKMAIAIAIIASAETLLCATAVDQMHRGPRTNYNRELMAQGVGNTLCGVVGALPITGVIVRSSANVAAGAKTRWSATLHGLWLLIFVGFLTAILERIPTACLAAILVYTGCKLVNWRAGLRVWRDSRGEGLICIATLIGVVFADLLTGVLIGVVLSVIKLAYTASHLIVRPERDEDRKEIHFHLEGAATFLSLPKLAQSLERVPAGWWVHVYLDELQFIDHACLHLLAEWEKQHMATGGRLTLDQEDLRARFNRARSRVNGNGKNGSDSTKSAGAASELVAQDR